MAMLTSRPTPNFSSADSMKLVRPAIEVLKQVSSLVVFLDDTQKSITDGFEIIEDTLNCFDFEDYVVMSSPGFAYELVYDVSIKPVEQASYVSFKTTFKVRP